MPGSSTSRPGRTWWYRLLLSSASVALMIVCLEAGLRQLHPWLSDALKASCPPLSPRWYGRLNDDADPRPPHWLAVGHDFTVTTEEFACRVRTTPYPGERFGVRDADVVLPAWGMALGNSFTFGSGVDEEASWPEQVARLSGRPVNNLGRFGASLSDAWLVLERTIGTTRPQVVLWGVFQNDLWDDYSARHPPAPPAAGLGRSAHFIKQWLWKNSATYGLVKFFYKRIFAGAAPVGRDPGNPAEVRLVELDMSLPQSQEGLRVARDALARAAFLCRQQDARLLVILIPLRQQVTWTEQDARWQGIDPLALNRALEALCAEQGIPVLDLLPVLRAAAARDPALRLYYPRDGHFTPRAHQLAAQTIVRALRRYGWLSAASPADRARWSEK